MMQSEYAEVPVERLYALSSFYLHELGKKCVHFRQQWIVAKRCKCVAALPRNAILNCIHVNTASNEKFKKEERDIGSLMLEIFKKLPAAPQLKKEWLKNLKL